jgi:peptidoglycan/xylan/chitin deacetylase (PgdA/CDA1 family)
MIQQVYIPSNSLFERLRRSAGVELFRKPFALPIDAKIITFTFDDFLKTAGDIGAAVLEEYGTRGTFYLSLGCADHEDHQGRYFSAENVKTLHARGHEIACHSYSHLDAARVSSNKLLEDVRKNAQGVRALAGNDIRLQNFAYPYGNVTPHAKRIVRREYVSGRSVRPGINRRKIDLACLLAIEINDRPGTVEFCHNAVDDVTLAGGWLIFFTHDIRQAPSDYGCTPDSFRTIVDHAAKSGATILSMRDALAFLKAKQGQDP